MEKTYFECSCEGANHVLRILRIPEDEWNDTCYVETHLKNLSFFKRLWLAVKYVFGYDSDYGHWEEYVWDKGNIIQMKEFCEKFLKENEK